MKTIKYIKQKYGPFYRQLWNLLKDQGGVMGVDDLVQQIPVGQGCFAGDHHRRRITNALSVMVKNQDIYRVARGQYAVSRRFERKAQHLTFKEQLSHYIEMRGRVEFKQIAEAFAPRTPKAVRSALDRLREEGRLVKDGPVWCWAGNVVTLLDRFKARER